MRGFCIHLDVSVSIVGPCTFEPDPLMPAMHTADRVRLNRKRQILVDPDLAPPDPLAVGIVAGEGTGPVLLPHPVACACAGPRRRARFPRDGDERARAAPTADLVLQPPASEVMRHAEHARANAFGHPRARDERPDARA